MQFELQEYTPKQMENVKAYQYTADMWRETAIVPGVSYTIEGIPYVLNATGFQAVKVNDWIVKNAIGNWVVMSDNDFRAWYE